MTSDRQMIIRSGVAALAGLGTRPSDVRGLGGPCPVRPVESVWQRRTKALCSRLLWAQPEAITAYIVAGLVGTVCVLCGWQRVDGKG